MTLYVLTLLVGQVSTMSCIVVILSGELDSFWAANAAALDALVTCTTE